MIERLAYRTTGMLLPYQLFGKRVGRQRPRCAGFCDIIYTMKSVLKMSRSIKLFLFAMVAVSVSLSAADDRPNFLFILVDDLGWADIGANGSTFYETPNVDGLAARGMRFTDGYVASPMCSPTRASIMSGKHPARLQMTNWIGAPQPENYKWNTILRSAPYSEAMPLEEVTVAETLQEAGYETVIFGKGKSFQYY